MYVLARHIFLLLKHDTYQPFPKQTPAQLGPADAYELQISQVLDVDRLPETIHFPINLLIKFLIQYLRASMARFPRSGLPICY